MEVTGINLCLEKKMDSDVDVIEVVQNLKDLEKPSFFENEVRNLDRDSYGKENFGIFFSDEGEEEYFLITFSETHESALHMHTYTKRRDLGKVKNFIEEVLREVGDLQVNILNFTFMLQEEMTNLGFDSDFRGDKIISSEIEREDAVYKFERRAEQTFVEVTFENEVISAFDGYVEEKINNAENYLGDINA